MSSIWYPSIVDEIQFPVILFIDGHSSHINLAVSEFCREKNIILYCFPAHSSHILQPLDVTVFGPLKKLWNSAINDFKAKFKTSVTKHCFLQVFDPAWKKCTEKRHSIAGFRATGLVPFNPNNVDYRKLLHSNIKSAATSTLSINQRLGITMTFQAIKGILTSDQVTRFEKRMEEDYNIVDETDGNKLWRIYKTVSLMQKGNASEEVAPFERNGSDNDSQSDSYQVEELQVNEEESNNRQRESTPPADISLNAPQHVPEDITNRMSEEPSTSSSLERKQSYGTFQFSPFKQYLQITDPSVVPSRKTPKRLSKTPCAVSGKDYIANLRQIHSRKEQEIKNKEERKKIREEKRKLKEASNANKQKKQRTQLEETNDDEETSNDEDTIMDLDNSSDEEEIFGENCCGACEGNEEWEDGQKWIGCNTCVRWFHKSCLSKEIELMTAYELESYEFVCNSCHQKSNKKNPLKQK